MKLLLVAPHYPPRYIGGVEMYTRRLAHRLRGRGFDTVAVAVEHLGAAQAQPVTADETSDDGIRVFRLSVAPAAPAAAFRSTYRHADVERWLGDFLRREEPDVIHLHSGYLLGGAVLAAAARLALPVVVTLHDFWFICPRINLLHPNQQCCSGPEGTTKCAWCRATEQRRYRLPERMLGRRTSARVSQLLSRPLVSRMTGWQERLDEIAERQRTLLEALSSAAAILSPSRFVRDQLARAGFPIDRIIVLPFGYEPCAHVPPRSHDQVALRVGYLGHLAPHKGAHVLIEAVRQLREPSVQLIVHGQLTREPEYVQQLRALAGDDSRILFAGPIEHARLDDLFRRIDILAVPSVCYENSPLVIHEARCSGLPVLASRLGGMAELVSDGHDGLLADPGSPVSFARQLGRLIVEPGLLERLRAGVRRPPTEEDETNALLGIYEQALRRRIA